MHTVKKSKFNISIQYDKKTMVIFNTKSMKACFLNDTEYEAYLNSAVDKKIEKQFLDNGIYVEESFDELYNLYLDRQKSNNRKEELNIWIYPTLKCNADCEYCFEKMQEKYDMNDETANLLVDYIKKKVQGFKKISLCWFGGEPLLNTHIIDLISSRLLDELSDVVVTSSLITNGSMINESIVNKMKGVWNITSVQITLDGAFDVYNKIKKYKNKKYTFELIISNIRMLLNAGIKVNIRLNYSGDNFDTLMSLINYLSNIFENKTNLFCYIYPIWSVENNGKLLYESNAESDEKLLALYKKIVEKKLSTLDKMINLKSIKSHCMACNKNNFSVLPNGNIIKCANLPELCVGNIENDIYDKQMVEEWGSPIIDEGCNNCVYLPLCQGGCLASKYGNMRKCFIQKEIMPQLLKLIFQIEKMKKGGD